MRLATPKNKDDLEKENRLRKLGDSLIDAILDDDPSSKYSDFSNNPNLIFKSNYKLPSILRHSPPILCVCCLFGSVKCFRTLIDLGADPFCHDDLNYTASHFVAFSGNLEIARELYKLKVDFNFPADQLFQYMPFLPPKHDGFYPQHIAAINGQQDFINWLWLKGSKIDKNLLIYASAYGNIETIKFLLEKLNFFKDDDQDDNKNDDIIKSAVNSAAVNGQDEVTAYLLNIFDKVNLTEPLIYAAKNGSLKCVKLIYEQQQKRDDVDAWEAFLYSCSFGYLDIVKYFIRKSVCPASFNSKMSKLPTPLECAVNNNHYEIAKAIISHRYARITTEKTVTSNENENNSLQSQYNSLENDQNELKNNSIENGLDDADSSSDADSHDDHSFFDERPRFLLDQATTNNSLQMVKLLVATFGIDTRTLASTANIAISNRSLALTEYYVDHGVSLRDLAITGVFLRDKKSRITLEKDRPLVDFFISRGVFECSDLALQLILCGDVSGLVYVIDQGADVTSTFLNKHVNEIFKENLMCEKYNMIFYLLDNFDVKVNDRMLFGLEIFDRNVYYELLKKFVEKGINLSTPKNGCSLLYYAIINQNVKAIKLLKENGADFTHVAIPIASFESMQLFEVMKEIIESENDFTKCIPKCDGKDDFIIQLYYNYHNSSLLKYLFEIHFICDVNKELDEDGNTLLDFALLNEDADMMLFLLSKGASFEKCSSSFEEFEDFAKSSKNRNLLEIVQNQCESYFSLEED